MELHIKTRKSLRKEYSITDVLEHGRTHFCAVIIYLHFSVCKPARDKNVFFTVYTSNLFTGGKVKKEKYKIYNKQIRQ